MMAESLQWAEQSLMPFLRSAGGWTLRTGVEASLVALLVLLAQRLLRDRISARWRHNLWLLVLARLVLPAVPQSEYSPFNYVPTPAVLAAKPPEPQKVEAQPVARPPVASSASAPSPWRSPARLQRAGTSERKVVAVSPRLPTPAVVTPPSAAVTHDSSMAESHVHSAPPGAVPNIESHEVAGEHDVAMTVVPIPLPGTVSEADSPRIAAMATITPPPTAVATPAASDTRAEPPVQPLTVVDLLVIFWAAVALLLLLRIAWATVRLWICVRRLPDIADPAIEALLSESLAAMSVHRIRRPTLRLAPPGCGPAVVGMLRPKILLPQYVLDRFTPQELCNVLLHELCHIRRHDVAINWLLCLLRAVHWFNPAVWFAGRRIVLEREEACDQAVLAAQSRGTLSATSSEEASPTYGATLIKLMELLLGSTSPGTGNADRRAAAFVGMVGVLDPAPRSRRRGTHLKELQRRLTMIARFDPATPSRRRWVIVSAGLSMLIGGIALTGAVQSAQSAPVPGAAPAQRTEPERGAAKPAAADPHVLPGHEAAPGAPPAATGAPAAPGDHEHRAAAPGEPELVLSPTMKAELQALELELKAKMTELEHYRTTLARYRELSRQGSIATAEVDRAEIESIKADAEFARARLRLEQFKEAHRPKPPAPRAPGSTTIDEHAVPGAAPAPGAVPGAAGGGNFGGPGAGGVANGDELNIVEDDATRVANADAAAKLHQPIGKIAFDGVPLGDVLGQLSSGTKLDILADWQAIESLGLTRESAVSLKLSGEFPAEHVLRWTLRSVGGEALGFWLDHGVVTITTQDRLNRITITRMYDLKEQGAKELMKEMKTLVSPNSWRESGGLGAIVWVDNRALVTQTGPNHRQIERLLSMVSPKPPKAAAGADSEGMQMYKEALRVEAADPALALARYKDVKRLLTPDACPSDLDDRIQRVEDRLKRNPRGAGH